MQLTLIVSNCKCLITDSWWYHWYRTFSLWIYFLTSELDQCCQMAKTEFPHLVHEFSPNSPYFGKFSPNMTNTNFNYKFSKKKVKNLKMILIFRLYHLKIKDSNCFICLFVIYMHYALSKSLMLFAQIAFSNKAGLIDLRTINDVIDQSQLFLWRINDYLVNHVIDRFRIDQTSNLLYSLKR